MPEQRQRLNPRKLLLSKWTARQVQQRERHFLVNDWLRDEQGEVLQVELQAVLTRRSQWIDWRELQDASRWQQGWL